MITRAQELLSVVRDWLLTGVITGVVIGLGVGEADAVVEISRPRIPHLGPQLVDAIAAFDVATVPAVFDALPQQREPTAFTPRKPRIESWGRLPLRFEANLGQYAEAVRFTASGPGYQLFLTADEAVLVLRSGKPAPTDVATTEAHAAATATVPPTRENRLDHRRRGLGHTDALPAPTPSAAAVRMRLEGSDRNAAPILEGLEKLSSHSNYLLGKDPSKWRTRVPHYGKVKYTGIYPGIDLVYYGNPQQLEYDFVLAPGADPSQIQLAFEGAEQIRIAANGDLVIQVAGGELVQRAPRIYQEIDGARWPVDGRYELRATANEKIAFAPSTRFRPPMVGFQVANYVPDRGMVIDPVLVYGTYLGGHNHDGGVEAIAVDTDGNAYVTGGTQSSDFPIRGAPYPNLQGVLDVFITKLDASGSALVYSTYLGGSATDVGRDIAVDADGNAYVTGETHSFDFPTLNALFFDTQCSYTQPKSVFGF